MDKQVITKKIFELKKEYQKQRFDLSLTKLKDTSKIKITKKEIARLYTQFNDPKLQEKK